MGKIRHKQDYTYIGRWLEKGVRDAVIDVDNTIIKTNITKLYFFMEKKRSQGIWGKVRWCLLLIRAALFWGPYYLILDFFDREQFQIAFYRRYHKFTVQEIEVDAAEYFQTTLKKRFIPYIHDLIFYLKKNNVKITLLSTNFEPVIKHVGQYFDVPYKCLGLKRYNIML